MFGYSSLALTLFVAPFSESLKPKLTFNPVLQRFYQSLEARALDSTADVVDLDPVIAKYAAFNSIPFPCSRFIALTLCFVFVCVCVVFLAGAGASG